MNQQNYFSWRTEVNQIAEERYGISEDTLSKTRMDLFQQKYFVEELSPQEAADQIFCHQPRER